MYTKCIKQLQKRCMIHEKQTIEKQHAKEYSVWAGVEQQQPNDHNHKTDFITVFNDENICEFVYTQKDFQMLLSNISSSFSVDCCVKHALSSQLLIWNDLPKGKIKERKSNVVFLILAFLLHSK